MENNDSLEIGKILKEALKIIDELSKYDINDLDSTDEDDLGNLIERAKKIKKHRLFVLK